VVSSRAAESRFGFCGGVLCLCKVEHAFGPLILDMNQLRSSTRLFESLSDDNRDRLVIMLDFGSAEQLAVL